MPKSALSSWRSSLRQLELSIAAAQFQLEGENALDLELALTAMLRSYQHLAESEWRLMNMIERPNDGVFRYDLTQDVNVKGLLDDQVSDIFQHARLSWCNQTMANTYKYKSPRQIIGKYLYQLMSPELAENTTLVRSFVSAHYRLSDGLSIEICRDGTQLYIDNNAMGRVENGKLVTFWGSIRQQHEKDVMPDHQCVDVTENDTKLLIQRISSMTKDPDITPEFGQKLNSVVQELAKVLHV